MPELTDAARAHLATGATTGPGTPLCAGCEGPKEPTRLNSSRCRACGTGGLGRSASPSPVRAITVTLPVAVMERFAAEAARFYAETPDPDSNGQTNDYLRHLIIKRDAKRYPNQ